MTTTLVYLANARVPSEKAHVFQIFMMCGAFSGLGMDVSLWHARRRMRSDLRSIDNPFSYYGVSRFDVRAVPSLDLAWLARRSQRLWFLVQSMSFSINALRHLKRPDSWFEAIYTRDLWIALRLAGRKRCSQSRLLIFEAHTFPQGMRKRWISRLRHCDLVVTITESLARSFEKAGIPRERILVAPDGVDLASYQEPIERAAARRWLGLEVTDRLVVYTGHLFEWKGTDTLIDAASDIPATVLFVGGTRGDLERSKERAGEFAGARVRFVGHVPPSDVPAYQVAADVLVLPNSAKLAISREHTSPLKLFEYMAAKRPIVASDLPSIREILTDGVNAVLVEPDSPEALAEGIKRVLDDPEWAGGLAAQAYEDVQEYTWEKRARRILDRLEAVLTSRKS